MDLLNMLKKTGRRCIGSSALSALVIVGISACNTEAKPEKAQVGGEAQAVVAKSASVGEDLKSQIQSKLKAVRPELPISDVVQTNVPGVVRVDITGSGAIYMVNNGEYFFTGDMYRVDPVSGFVNVTEQERAAMRGPLIASVNPSDTISFKPEGEVKAVINVFTDVDCGYCQKLHQEVPELNNRGIEVRYLAFPRAGIPSPSYDKIASAWCASDPQDALTKVKNRQKIDTNVCDGNPVADQYKLGKKMGVSGTPAIVLMNGDLVPGYMPADRLAARLGVN